MAFHNGSGATVVFLIMSQLFQALVSEIETAMTVFAHGLNKVSTQSEERKLLMTKSDVSCYTPGPVQWRGGEQLRSIQKSKFLIIKKKSKYYTHRERNVNPMLKFK